MSYKAVLKELFVVLRCIHQMFKSYSECILQKTNLTEEEIAGMWILCESFPDAYSGFMLFFPAIIFIPHLSEQTFITNHIINYIHSNICAYSCHVSETVLVIYVDTLLSYFLFGHDACCQDARLNMSYSAMVLIQTFVQ